MPESATTLREPEGPAGRVLGLEEIVPEIPSVVVTRPFQPQLEAAGWKGPPKERREHLAPLVLPGRVVGRGERFLAHPLEDEEVLAEGEPVLRDVPIEHTGSADVEPVEPVG